MTTKDSSDATWLGAVPPMDDSSARAAYVVWRDANPD
jgi:hypothetical protein